jgi:DNA-binding response OmpR family regulator
MLIAKNEQLVIEKESQIGIDLDDALRGNKRVLIVEDDPDTIDLLKRILIVADFDVASSNNGLEAPSIAKKIQPDVILLDLMMPEQDGKKTLTELRRITHAPVIIVSALDEKEMIVDLLNSGSDDYITKPFDRHEIIARINALLRRSKQENVFDGVSIPEINLLINFSKREVLFQDNLVNLSPKEFDLLQTLIIHMPNVVQYSEISKELWGELEKNAKNRIKYLVHSIRKKLQKINPNIIVLITVDRFGYRIQSD